MPDKLDLKLLGNYQKVDGNNVLASPAGGAPDVARRALGGVSSIAAFDDTQLWSVNAELAYKLEGGWTVVVGSWLEDYELRTPPASAPSTTCPAGCSSPATTATPGPGDLHPAGLRIAGGLRMSMRHMVTVTCLAAAGAWALSAGPASASMPMMKKAKELGITSVQNCQSCHVDKLPKKDAHKVNERGKWLVDQKEKRRPKEIDVAWLKEYVEKEKK